MNHAVLWPRYTVWLADYRQAYNTTLGRDMHQYTSTGSVAGVNGNVDCNRCYRDFPAEIGSLCRDTAQQAQPVSNEVHCTGNHVMSTSGQMPTPPPLSSPRPTPEKPSPGLPTTAGVGARCRRDLSPAGCPTCT